MHLPVAKILDRIEEHEGVLLLTESDTVREVQIADELLKAEAVVNGVVNGHVAHMLVNGSEFPYIPQWITIFILMLMFTVDFYQNWLERKREQAPVELHRRKK